MEGPTDGRTDKPSYRDARTDLKRGDEAQKGEKEERMKSRKQDRSGKRGNTNLGNKSENKREEIVIVCSML